LCGVERRVPHIGTYRRRLPVSVERLYENAIDWEHLPHLHRSTFARVDCLESGDWGFRARVWQRFREDEASFLLELRLDRDCRRWITTILDGPGSGAEIWTHAFPAGERCTDIVVDFFAPGAAPERIGRLREFYLKLYGQLYDEDVRMMTVRQERLDAARRSANMAIGRFNLGPLNQLCARLPLALDMGGRKFRLVEVDGELITHSTVCPHMLGPLEDGALLDGAIVECPWHGYRFDLRTGACISGAHCSLPRAPRVNIDPATSEVTVTMGEADSGRYK
jgi:nitrite reductase/ring-hydroxylating ferredoxin subunit